MFCSYGRGCATLVLAVAAVGSIGKPSWAEEGAAKKVDREAFEVSGKVVTHFDDGERDTLTAPKLIVLAGHSGNVCVGRERTITIAPKATENVFEGTSITVTIRKGAKGKYIFDVEGTRTKVVSDGLSHSEVKKRSNRVVSPLDFRHKFVLPMQPATKTQKAVDLEFTVKRVKA